jgi:hypothetical protein
MKRIAALFMVPVIALGMSACSVEQTEEGEMPEVEGGQLPEYDVDAADVDVNLDTTTVVVPDVDVTPPNEDTTGVR